MTNAEAIKIINQYDCNFYWTDGEKIPTEDLIEAFYLAVKALKEQEPVKPVPAINDVGDWLCGNCFQGVVGEEELDASGFVQVKFNFCPNCGREVKWG